MEHVILNAEQVERLEAVDLSAVAEGADAKPKRQRPKQIPSVDRRLNAWAEWTLSNSDRYGESAGSTMLGALIDGGGMIVRSTNPSAGSMPDAIFDTDKAVNRLGDELRQVVHLQYLSPDLSAVERAARCGRSERWYRMAIGKAHQEILFLLQAPPNLRSRRSR